MREDPKLRLGNVGRCAVFEPRRTVLDLVREGDPDLHAEHVQADRAVVGEGAFGVGDAFAGRHPVHGTGLDRLDGARRVAVFDPSGQQVRERRETDVWVRIDVHADTRSEVLRVP